MYNASVSAGLRVARALRLSTYVFLTSWISGMWPHTDYGLFLKKLSVGRWGD